VGAFGSLRAQAGLTVVPEATPKRAEEERPKASYPALAERWTSSLGGVFPPVLGLPIRFCIWDKRVLDFKAFVAATAYPVGDRMFGLRKEAWRERSGACWRKPGFAQPHDYSVPRAFPASSVDGGGHAYRIYRRGAWNDSHPVVLLLANRRGDGFACPGRRYDNTGFRCVLANKSPH